MLRIGHYGGLGRLLWRAWSPMRYLAAEDSRPGAAWRGEYYANQNLAGAPTLVRYDRDIRFNWGTGSPAPGLPADHFSIRWTQTAHFDGGLYHFTATVDDGIRVFVDGQLLIDQWKVTAATTYEAGIELAAGDHSLRVEYFEAGGVAEVTLDWTPSGPVGAGWRGEYFNNRALAGAPVLVRMDPDINYDWGDGSPAPGIAQDNFSVRWTHSLDLSADTYRFYVHIYGGVRLFVDDQLLVNQWHDADNQLYQADCTLTAGPHVVRLEYYDYTGPAAVQLTWRALSQRLVGNILTYMRPQNSWIKVYRLELNGSWTDLNPHGYGPLSKDGFLKIDGMVVDPYYAQTGHPYRVECYADGALLKAVGDTAAGQPEFRVFADRDNATPWGPQDLVVAR